MNGIVMHLCEKYDPKQDDGDRQVIIYHTSPEEMGNKYKCKECKRKYKPKTKEQISFEWL